MIDYDIVIICRTVYKQLIYESCYFFDIFSSCWWTWLNQYSPNKKKKYQIHMTRRLTNHLSVNCWPMQSLSSVTLTLYICYTEIGSLLFQHAALFKVAIIFLGEIWKTYMYLVGEVEFFIYKIFTLRYLLA